VAHGEGIGSPASDFPLIDRAWTLAEDVEEFLREEAATLQTAAGLTPEEELDLLVQHDRVRFETEHGVSEKAIPIAESILEKVPTFIPVRNNPSLPYFQQGDIEKAIAMAQEVLAEDPSNFHALANLVRYTFLSGAFAEADEFRALANAHMAIAMAGDEKAAARSWLAMWQEIEEDHPDQAYWQLRLQDPGALMAALKRLISGG
jgi:tetratricopeptide (TPR) repeat protein